MQFGIIIVSTFPNQNTVSECHALPQWVLIVQIRVFYFFKLSLFHPTSLHILTIQFFLSAIYTNPHTLTIYRLCILIGLLLSSRFRWLIVCFSFRHNRGVRAESIANIRVCVCVCALCAMNQKKCLNQTNVPKPIQQIFVVVSLTCKTTQTNNYYHQMIKPSTIQPILPHEVTHPLKHTLNHIPNHFPKKKHSISITKDMEVYYKICNKW